MSSVLAEVLGSALLEEQTQTEEFVNDLLKNPDEYAREWYEALQLSQDMNGRLQQCDQDLSQTTRGEAYP